MAIRTTLHTTVDTTILRIRQPITQRHDPIPTPAHPPRLHPLPQPQPLPLSRELNHPKIRIHKIPPRHAHPQKPRMRHHHDRLLRAGAQFAQDGLAARDDGLPRVAVDGGGGGGGLVWVERVDGGEVDLGEEGL